MSIWGFIVAAIFFIWHVVKESRGKPLPPGAFFDKDAELEDIKNGVPYSVRKRKYEDFSYWVTVDENGVKHKVNI